MAKHTSSRDNPVKLSPHKARKMLREKKKRSKKQRGFLGVIASGKTPTKVKS